MTLDNASILEEVKKWCFTGDLKITLQHEEWADFEWKDLETKKSRNSLRWLLEGDGVEKADSGSVADSIIKHVTKLLKDSVKVSEEPVDLNSLKASFSLDYKGVETVDEFRKYLNKCYDEWIGITYKRYSPYFSVVQSSGYGKSRMCKEFALTDTNWLTVYVCLEEGTNRYPPGQSLARSVLKTFAEEISPEACTLKMKHWISALAWLRVMFQCLFSEIDEHGEKTLEKLEGSVNTVSNDYSPTMCYTDLMNCKQPNDQSDENKQEQANKERKAFWSCCEDAKSANKIHSYVKKLQPYCDEKFYQEDTKILLVIDEARFLVENKLSTDPSFNLFRGFRGGMKEFTRSTFAVVVDTVSRVSNFSPSQGEDPSFRHRLGDDAIRNTSLFSPFHWVCTTNVLCNDGDIPFLYGRPLWKTFSLSYNNNVRVDLLNFAIKKLMSAPSEVTSPVAMSVLSILTGLSISPMSNLAESLVASHMATCLAINESRDSLYVMYPVEPILSEAAFTIFREKYMTEQIKDQLLKPLVSHLRYGIVDYGHRGELVAKILLLLARSKEYKQFENVTLEKYISELTKFGIPEKNDVSGDVSFNCFTKVNRENVPFKEFWNSVDPGHMLKTFYFHRAAIEFPERQRGADLLIPICQASSDGTSKYKYILVQVKNVIQFEYNTSVSKLAPSYVFEGNEKWCDYSIGWSLLINVAPGQEGNDVMQLKDNVLIVPCLDNFKHLLHVGSCDNLTDTFIDILRDKTARRWIPEGQWKSLDSFNPLGNLVLNSCSNSQS